MLYCNPIIPFIQWTWQGQNDRVASSSSLFAKWDWVLCSFPSWHVLCTFHIVRYQRIRLETVQIQKWYNSMNLKCVVARFFLLRLFYEHDALHNSFVHTDSIYQILPFWNSIFWWIQPLPILIFKRMKWKTCLLFYSYEYWIYHN